MDYAASFIFVPSVDDAKDSLIFCTTTAKWLDNGKQVPSKLSLSFHTIILCMETEG